MPNCKFVQIENYRVCYNCTQTPLKRKPDAPPTYRQCTQDRLIRKRFLHAVSLGLRFSLALWRWATDCFRRASWAVKKARYQVCLRCKFIVKKERYRVCKICGCGLKTKVAWRKEECPARHWLAIGSKHGLKPLGDHEQKLRRNNVA